MNINKYPYTDFHELNLDWFLAQFKTLVEEWQQTETQWNTMRESFTTLEGVVNQFTTFVTNYFNNLDVQQEVNNKLNAMAEDGSLSQLLAPLVAQDIGGAVADQIGAAVADKIGPAVAKQIGPAVGNQIGDAVAPEVPGAVTHWLNDNVTPVGSAVTVDSSLTISGSAADAKTCGDKFNDINENLDNSTERINPSKNMFNYAIFNRAGITENDGIYSGTAATIASVPAASDGVIRPFEPNTQYTFSMKCYTDGNAGTESNGIYISLEYTDNTRARTYIPNNLTTEAIQSVTSVAGKSVDHIAIGYVSQGSNIWHIREVQVEKGTSVTSYVEPDLGDYTAKDIVARNDIPEIKDNILPWYSVFEKEFLKIAYSAIWVDKINTSTHWLFASDMGFNTLKGDVEITSDGELIMCHDPGFTFDANGRIIAYDANNNTPIISMTYAECRSKVYAENPQRYGGYCPVADIDDFISICKEKGKICFVTIRSTNTAAVVEKLISKIHYYNMESRTIINALSASLLEIVRQNPDADNIAMNLVAPEGVAITTANVDTCIGLKRCFLSIWSNGSDVVLDESTSAIAYAKSKNIPLLAGSFGSISYWNKIIDAGIIGAQIHKPIFDVDQKSYRFTAKMTAGVVSFGNLFASDRFSATISKTGSIISISNIKITGSRLTNVIDGLQPIKMNTLNPEIRCLDNAGNNIPVKWENNSIKITVLNDTDNTYTVLVRV